MNKNKLDSSRNDPDVIKEYQAIVRKLQEEMYTMKNSMAVQEEVIKTFKENEQIKISEIVLANQKDLKMSLKYAQEEISVKNELIQHYEVEIKNLYCTLKESEKNNQRLNREIEAYKDSLNSDSLLEIAAENTTLEQKIEVTQNLRRSAEVNADFYKAELEAKSNELKDLTDQLHYLKTEQKGQLRKDELQQIIVTKDEQLRKMNKKFQTMTQKIDNLIKEKESLEETTKNLEKDKKKLMERWKQSSSRNKEDVKLIVKNKKLDEEVFGYKTELENVMKKHQELYQKHIGLVQDREADLVYIDRLKEEIVKIKTNWQILMDEREVLSKINEELSISNHLKETQIENLKSTIRPSNDYKFAVEMNVSLESKLRSYENTIAALKFQLQQRVEGLYKLGQEVIEKKDIAVQINSFNEGKVVNVPSVEEIKSLVEDFNSLLEKYRSCKEKKNMMIKRNEKLIEKIQALSGQVQSDHYMILHLRGKAKTPGLDSGHVKELSKSQFDLTYKRKSLNGKN